MQQGLRPGYSRLTWNYLAIQGRKEGVEWPFGDDRQFSGLYFVLYIFGLLARFWWQVENSYAAMVPSFFVLTHIDLDDGELLAQSGIKTRK